MKSPYDIILTPVITEASMEGIPNKVYTFRVALDANKIEIKQAVEKAFGVKVKKVNTAIYEGKEKRVGVHTGRRSDYKKAIVTLTEKSREIEFFSGMI